MNVCTRCILDSVDDPSIEFDADGVCNHCRGYDEAAAKFTLEGAAAERELERIVGDIKGAGGRKAYDSVIGLSGGVDSTYLAYIAVRLGLRPLAIHFDNGWNSELANQNIENTVRRLNLDLKTYVVNWEEFRDIQIAYLRASVVDIEAITDHGIFGALYRLAAKNKVRYILSGTNVATEAVLPAHWYFNKGDAENIKSIHRAFGARPLRTYPLFHVWAKKYHINVLGIQQVSILNAVPYVKADAKRTIARELGWRDYGMKHGESIFTRFYQGYILPTKFGIDKRKAHLSNLICSKQLTRDEALRQMSEPAYDPALAVEDRAFVLKKLGLSSSEFDALMRQPPRRHTDFRVERSLYDRYPGLRRFRPLFDRLKHPAVRPA